MGGGGSNLSRGSRDGYGILYCMLYYAQTQRCRPSIPKEIVAKYFYQYTTSKRDKRQP